VIKFPNGSASPRAHDTIKGVPVGVEIVEIGCNWRSVANLRSSRETLWPGIEILREQGIPICEKPTSILLPLHVREDIRTVELRDWLDGRAKEKKRERGWVKMFNRFNYDEQKFQIKRAYLGVNFRFEESEDAFLFKMFYY